VQLRPRIGWALVLCAGCGAPEGHRHPTFPEGRAPAPTLVMGAAACLEVVEVASGGMRIRRATRWGEEAVRRLDERLGRMGELLPSLPRSRCNELTSEQAARPDDFDHPSPPDGLGELTEAGRARSLLVAVVSSRVSCERGRARWRWGEPAYHDPDGQVDCHESGLDFGAFLYRADGTLLWKSYRRLELEGEPDSTAVAGELLDAAPVTAAR
jgi:hypothetical protein